MYPTDAASIRWRYFLDLPDLITCVVVGIALLITNLCMSVDPLYVPPNDSTSSFPFPGKSTIPTVWLIVMVFGIGIVVIIAFFFLSRRFPSIFRTFNPFAALWGLVTIVLFTSFVTEIFKNYVGRARPDIYAACGENATMEMCQEKFGSRDGADQFKSWPSGHSSTAMSGFSCVTFFGQKVVRCKWMAVSVLWGLFIILAIFVGATRIRDFRHRADDVLAGLFIGFVVSIVLWSRFSKRIFGKEKAEILPGP